MRRRGEGLHSNKSHTSSLSLLSTLSPWLLMLLNRLSSHRKLHHRGGEEGGVTKKNVKRRSGQMGRRGGV